MSILKKATAAVKKALKPSKGKGKKKSSYNKGLSWKLDRLYASSEEHEKAYASNRKKAYKTRTKKSK